VPDYPAPGADLVTGGWTGGRLTASSSASDATALPNVAPAIGPVAAIDGDSATSWVSNALQAAVGQWLQVDFDHPVTNATITVTPSATAVGAQIRRMQLSTVNGTTTQSANTGLPASQLLWTGPTPVNWGSVQWGSVQWGSVQWGSVQWGSVQWGSVQWGSDYWGP